MIYQREHKKDKVRDIRSVAERVINNAMKSAENTVNSGKNITKSTTLWRFQPSTIEIDKTTHSTPAATRWHWEIKDFSLARIVAQINDYVNLWQLSKGIKFCIKHIMSHFDEIAIATTSTADACDPNVIPCCTSPKDDDAVPRDTSRHTIDVLFSKPTMVCPNPLAVAKVHFIIYAVALKEDKLQLQLQPIHEQSTDTGTNHQKHPNHQQEEKDSPCTLVRVKYQFEGFKSWHMVDSDRFDFQDAYIRFILNSKARFFFNGVLN
ncbi:uncharacterized protein LOC129918796 [Episyrphus balteatus]|uniref:uncharacterized protein LOC129918796 n=1 Tax=Episyrphus balteatus TaxID=286459 RepID=UPI0024853BA0|nr:uncharacterized protein LOC129918796 [Episyrphus balteatus]